MSRLDPKNREEAFSYQLEDDVKMLKVASLSGEKEFEQALQRLETTINAYKNKRLRNDCLTNPCVSPNKMKQITRLIKQAKKNQQAQKKLNKRIIQLKKIMRKKGYKV